MPIYWNSWKMSQSFSHKSRHRLFLSFLEINYKLSISFWFREIFQNVPTFWWIIIILFFFGNHWTWICSKSFATLIHLRVKLLLNIFSSHGAVFETHRPWSQFRIVFSHHFTSSKTTQAQGARSATLLHSSGYFCPKTQAGRHSSIEFWTALIHTVAPGWRRLGCIFVSRAATITTHIFSQNPLNGLQITRHVASRIINCVLPYSRHIEIDVAIWQQYFKKVNRPITQHNMQ